jgi:hypothetical protein
MCADNLCLASAVMRKANSAGACVATRRPVWR